VPFALLVVNSPILHPIAASAGQCIAWYVGVSLVVLRQAAGRWEEVRRLPFDNAGALAPHLIDGALTPFSADDLAMLRPLLPQLFVRPREPDASPPYPGMPGSVERSA
jgi:hypothetical protein